MLLRAVILLLLAGFTATHAATPNETARFLAGLSLDGTSLAELGNQKAWAQHAKDFDAAWKQLQSRQLAKIAAWGPENLDPEYSGAGNVFYFFSGPDELYADALFPHAANCVLVAREPVGTVPDPQKIVAGELAPALTNLRKSLDAVLSFSFFITKNMKEDLHHQQLNGTLPVIMVFLARDGATIDAVDFLGIDKMGAPTDDPKPANHGVKITFHKGDGAAPQTVYYFEADLGDDVLRKNDAVLKFCDTLGRGSSLLKAASFLMHGGNFEIVKKYILTQSDLVVEDDSGIPFRVFEKEKWQLKFFGHYDGPIARFNQYPQKDLVAAYKAAGAGPLGFSFGYQWAPVKSCLIEARPAK